LTIGADVSLSRTVTLAGVVDGPGHVTLYGQLNWLSGGRMIGSGQLTADNGGWISIAATGLTVCERPVLLIGGGFFMEQGGDKVLKLLSVQIGDYGVIDVNDNALIIDYDSDSPLQQIQESVVAARNGGTWDVFVGITSSAAYNNVNFSTTLGVMEATDYKSMHGSAARFSGVAIDDTAVLVKYTYYGDADFSGSVNVADLGILASNWQQSPRTFAQGDFDYSGTVDVNDLGMLASNWQQSLARAELSPSKVASKRTTSPRLVDLVL
jgi:hypothetical protein